MVDIDPAQLIPAGTLVINDYCYADSIFGCLGRVDVTISALTVLPPATPLAVRLAPTIAPVLTGAPGPLGELAELKIAQLLVDVVADPNFSGETLLATLAVDARLGFEMSFVAGGIALTITPPGPADLTIALLDGGGARSPAGCMRLAVGVRAVAQLGSARV